MTMRAKRRLGWVLAALCALTSPAQAGQAWDAPQLMQSLRQVKSASAQFVERKTLGMLSQPLVSSGTLLYVAPDQLQKITVFPKRERLIVDGDRLVIESGAEDRTRSLSLSGYPEIGAFVEGIRATLAGDLAALDRYYAVHLDGDAESWRLLLDPKSPSVKDFVKWIRISGRGNKITMVEMDGGDGDHSEMSIAEEIH
jgi:outer membrane lipoprotein-sorting protein